MSAEARIDRGRVEFKWNAASHFAAVDYLRRQHRHNRLVRFGAPLAMVLLFIAALFVFEDGVTFDYLPTLLAFFAAFSVLAAVAWTTILSQPVRRLLLRRGSTVRCALEFDGQGIRVDIGRSPIRYPWSKVRSVAEDAEYLFVHAGSACFAIPRAAFASPVEAESFLARMRGHLAR